MLEKNRAGNADFFFTEYLEMKKEDAEGFPLRILCLPFCLLQFVLIVFAEDADSAFVAFHGSFDEPGHGLFLIFFAAFTGGECIAVVGHSEGIAFFSGFLVPGNSFCNV